MTAEQIFDTWGCNRGAAWLRAIRALSDAEFERLAHMQEEEDHRCEMVHAALSGIPDQGSESAAIGPATSLNLNVGDWEVRVDQAGESCLVKVFCDGQVICSAGFPSYDEADAAASMLYALHGFDLYRPAFPHPWGDADEEGPF